jgi:VanZ family protein
MMANEGRGRSDERICLLVSLAITASLAYGSLVPFNLRAPETFSPGGWLEQVRFPSWADASSGDLLVNMAVGAPLGFFLMGALYAGQRRNTMRIARAVIGYVSVLGTKVELLQVLSPVRQSSWNDVLAQDIGAAIGMLGWLVAGSSTLRWMRQIAAERESSKFVARLLQIYLLFYVVVQLTPNARLRGELAAVSLETLFILVPSSGSLESRILLLCNLGGNALLNVPIGALAWLSRPRSVARALCVGLSILAALVVAQSGLSWRHTTVSDVIAGATGVVIGLAAARSRPAERFRGLLSQQRLMNLWIVPAAGTCLLMLVAHSWTNDLAVITEKPDLPSIRLSRVSFYRSYSAHPWGALHESLIKFLLPIPLGLVLGLTSLFGVRERFHPLRLAGIGAITIILVAVELAPSPVPAPFPDVTNALIGTAGVLTGIAIGGALVKRVAYTHASKLVCSPHSVR